MDNKQQFIIFEFFSQETCKNEIVLDILTQASEIDLPIYLILPPQNYQLTFWKQAL